MRFILKRWVVALAAWLCLGTAAAVPYTAPNGDLIEIEYWAGSGANEAVLVVDFLQGADDVYAFGFRWDGAADGGDAVTAIVGAGALDASITNFGPPPPNEDLFINSLTYESTTLVNKAISPWSPAWIYWTDDAVGPGELIEWVHMGVGMSSHALTDGSFEGWVFSPDVWPNYETAPRQPLGVIPEPCTVALLAAGLFGLARRRRRRG